MAVGKQLSDGNPSGTSVGQSTTDLVSVYNVTPIAQAAALTAVSTSAAVATTGNAALYGFTSTQAAAIITAVNALITAVKNFGITA